MAILCQVVSTRQATSGPHVRLLPVQLWGREAGGSQHQYHLDFLLHAFHRAGAVWQRSDNVQHGRGTSVRRDCGGSPASQGGRRWNLGRLGHPSQRLPLPQLHHGDHPPLPRQLHSPHQRRDRHPTCTPHWQQQQRRAGVGQGGRVSLPPLWQPRDDPGLQAVHVRDESGGWDHAGAEGQAERPELVHVRLGRQSCWQFACACIPCQGWGRGLVLCPCLQWSSDEVMWPKCVLEFIQLHLSTDTILNAHLYLWCIALARIRICILMHNWVMKWKDEGRIHDVHCAHVQGSHASIHTAKREIVYPKPTCL